MSTGDMPSIGSSAYGSSTSTFSLGGAGGEPIGLLAMQAQQPVTFSGNLAHLMRRQYQSLEQVNPQPEKPIMPSRRLVQVFIADSDENVPLDKSLIYSGEQKFTDATDQELYFEIDIKSVLDRHNAERVKIVNKKVKERTEFLEPVKIRDLKMVVVNVATF